MAWTEISVSVPRESTNMIELLLSRFGALAVTLQDEADHPVLEPGVGETPLWPVVSVRGLFEQDVVRAEVQAALTAVPGLERPDRTRWRDVADEDWARSWMDDFRPMKFGERLWIVPGGMEIPRDPQNIEINLDPGLAFGTGTHPTTALCLEWLDGRDVSGQCVVDYGCGSGVLGVAAALMGAARVVCVDNDPQALEATRENACRNGVGDRISNIAPEEFREGSVDLVLANILAGPLIGLAPRLTKALKRGGSLVLSGILAEQAGEVAAAYRGALTRIDVENRDGWIRLAGCRR